MSKDAKIITSIIFLIGTLICGFFIIQSFSALSELNQIASISIFKGAIQQQEQEIIKGIMLYGFLTLLCGTTSIWAFMTRGSGQASVKIKKNGVWDTYKNRDITFVDGTYLVEGIKFKTLVEVKQHIDTLPEPEPELGFGIVMFEGMYCVGTKEFSDLESAESYAQMTITET